MTSKVGRRELVSGLNPEVSSSWCSLLTDLDIDPSISLRSISIAQSCPVVLPGCTDHVTRPLPDLPAVGQNCHMHAKHLPLGEGHEGVEGPCQGGPETEMKPGALGWGSTNTPSHSPTCWTSVSQRSLHRPAAGMLMTHVPSDAPTQTQEIRISGDLAGDLLCWCVYAPSSLRTITMTSGSTSLLTNFFLACVPFPLSKCFTTCVPTPAAALISLGAKWTGL